MNLWKEYTLPVMPFDFVIGGRIAARFFSHRPFGLSVNQCDASCFAGPFLRFGWDKSVVAFLCIFVITSLFTVGCWIERRHYQSTLPPQEPSEKVQS
ncbi:MAG: hypothetical protein U0941_14505 [Planctomycetaceae bacterium]